MRMVRIQIDRQIKFLAEALDESRDLANPHKAALSFGRANQHGYIYFARCFDDRS